MLGNDLLKRSGLSFAIRMAGLLFSYIFASLVARIYGPYGSGTFSLALSATVVFITLGKLGFDSALLRLASHHDERGEHETIKAIYNKAILLIILFGLALSLVYWFGIEYICTEFFKKPEQVKFMRLATWFILPNVLLIVNTEGLRGLKMVNHYIILQFVTVYMVGTLIVLAGTFWETNEGFPIMAHSAGLVLSCLFSFWFWHNRTRHFPKPLVNASTKFVLQTGWPLLAGNLVLLFIQNTDGLLLGRLFKMEDLGIYSNCLKLSNFISFPILAVVSGAAPKFARLHAAGDKVGLQLFVLQTSKVIGLAALPLALFLMLASPWILEFTFGIAFVSGWPVLCVLTLSGLITCLSGPSDSLLQMSGNQHLYKNIIFSAGLISVLLLVILVPVFGLLGAALANLITVLCWNLLSVYFIRKRLGINMNWLVHFWVKRK